MLTTLLAASLVRLLPMMKPYDLRCEALSQPLAIGTTAPRFAWKLETAAEGSRDLRQSGYEIWVGSSPGSRDLWDSGRVKSSATYAIAYQGKPLTSNQQCYWQVRVFDQRGGDSGWSGSQVFGVGLLSPTDWKAEWIGFDQPRDEEIHNDLLDDGGNWIWGEGNRAVLVRDFDLKSVPETAAMRITCDDMFSLKINGEQVASTDGKDDSWRRPLLLDVKSYLKAGHNRIEVTAEDTGGSKGLIAGLRILTAEGETLDIRTDQKWKALSASGQEQEVAMLGQYGAGPWGKISPEKLTLPPTRLLRNEFKLTKPVIRAMLYGSALGLAEFKLNGKLVSNNLFVPGWSDYTKRVYVESFDVTRFHHQGDNAIGIELGDGWYSGYVGYGRHRDLYGWKTRALAQLQIEYADGSTQVVATSPTWRGSTGPRLYSDFLMGESYDAAKEQDGWSEPGFSEAGWSPVSTGSEVKPALEMFPGQPVRAYQVLKAKDIWESAPDTYVLDLGQNMAGFARLELKGMESGQKLTLRFAERLNPDRTIYTANLRGALATDVYVCKGTPTEAWTPAFTFHGFQYIEITGLGHKPSADEVTGIAISSATPTTGTIETSDAMINQLVSNAWWTQRMNFIDIPTDCPQRDERLGWTGDAQAYIRTATMFTDVHPFFKKWLVALDDAQRADGQFPMVAPLKVAEGDGGPAWADAGVICPWTIYDVYGDRELLERHYPQMKKFIEFCVKRSKPDLTPPDQYHCFGDWLNIGDDTPHDVIYSAYFAGSTRLVAQAAHVLGKTADAKHFDQLYQKLRKVFQKAYVKPDGTVLSNSQCAYVLALAFDLLDGENVQKAADHLVANIEQRGWHLSTGFVGTRDIMNVLSKIGRNDVAFRLLHNTTFPSWGFTIKNGATSIWERWDGWTPDKGFQDPGMNSFAHYAFGAVVGWMFAQPAGIMNLDAGFGKIRIAPEIDPNLTFLKSSYDSVRGKIVSNWQVGNGTFDMHVEVPPNVQAEVVVPYEHATAKGLKGVSKGGQTIFRVGSGTYSFSAKLKP